MRILKKELWPCRVAIDTDGDKITEIETWLGENLGCITDQWNVVYQYNKTDFYFREAQEATMFALRWS